MTSTDETSVEVSLLSASTGDAASGRSGLGYVGRPDPSEHATVLSVVLPRTEEGDGPRDSRERIAAAGSAVDDALSTVDDRTERGVARAAWAGLDGGDLVRHLEVTGETTPDGGADGPDGARPVDVRVASGLRGDEIVVGLSHPEQLRSVVEPLYESLVGDDRRGFEPERWRSAVAQRASGDRSDGRHWGR